MKVYYTETIRDAEQLSDLWDWIIAQEIVFTGAGFDFDGGHYIEFQDPADALLFKLTWANTDKI